MLEELLCLKKSRKLNVTVPFIPLECRDSIIEYAKERLRSGSLIWIKDLLKEASHTEARLVQYLLGKSLPVLFLVSGDHIRYPCQLRANSQQFIAPRHVPVAELLAEVSPSKLFISQMIYCAPKSDHDFLIQGKENRVILSQARKIENFGSKHLREFLWQVKLRSHTQLSHADYTFVERTASLESEIDERIMIINSDYTGVQYESSARIIKKDAKKSISVEFSSAGNVKEVYINKKSVQGISVPSTVGLQNGCIDYCKTVQAFMIAASTANKKIPEPKTHFSLLRYQHVA